MILPVRPTRGGFLRPFGCGWFIREFLLGRGPEGSPQIDPEVGAPQADIFYYYKLALMRATALDGATRLEEEGARREGRPIRPEEIMARLPYRTRGARYHSFLVYFRNLKALGYVEETGETEPSALQDHYPPAPPRIFYRFTRAGREATTPMLSDPLRTLYGYEREKRSPKTRQYVRPSAPRGYARRRARQLAREGRGEPVLPRQEKS